MQDTPEIIEIPSVISVSDLADLMDVSAVEVVKALMRGGYMYAINDVIDHDIAAVVVQFFGYITSELDEDAPTATSLTVGHEDEDPEVLEARPPVVTILGHVDHGKTTLLDSIRQTNVVDGEAGGITQHIAAYQIESEGNKITFLDTPGHEAFTAMRARGAQVTDIAILVVAADDGVMPQTVEAISHARAAEVPILIAVTKKDLPSADVQNVYRQLSEQNLLVEEWGGDIIAVPVSGITGDGVDSLIENILLVTEISELKANPERNARGVVIEARMERNRGSIATALVQTGTLRQGDTIVTGSKHGKVRAMFDDKGSRIQEAGPSSPVEIMGINEVPDAGVIFDVADNEKQARQMIDENLVESVRNQTSLQEAYARGSSTETHQVDLIVKTDVQGSVEAIRASLEDLNSETSKVNLIHIASGNITERDVLLAIASDAVVIGFNTHPEGGAHTLARQEGIEIRQYSIIYNLIDDVSKALEGLLEPSYKEVLVGRASVRAVFNLGRRTRVAGMYVNDGRITRESTIHVMRGGEEIFVGEVSTLKHFKNDVREVATGLEGGVTVEGFNEFEEDDVLEAYVSEEV